ncbi:MAG TPA: response regulator, partial [Pseudobdellovibrionaceae bacterium]
MAAVSGDNKFFFSKEISKLLKTMKALGSERKDIEIVICGSKQIIAYLQLKEFFLSFEIESVKFLFVNSDKNVTLDFTPFNFQCRIPETEINSVFPALLEPQRKIKVLIVDDSFVIQKILNSVLSTDAMIEVVGMAHDAFQAEEIRKKTHPDVMTLDIHMPKKDGVTYLAELLSADAIPVIMISDLSRNEASPVMRALEMGAFDYLQKPSAQDVKDFGEALIGLIKVAGGRKPHLARSVKRKKERKRPSSLPYSARASQGSLVAIGSSTGGTEVIREIISSFPEDMPPTLIVQHMPAVFTAKFAD